MREEGCFFTDGRIVAFRDGKVSLEAEFDDVASIELERSTAFFKLAHVTVVRADGTPVVCELPDVYSYPNDTVEFTDKLRRAWQAQ